LLESLSAFLTVIGASFVCLSSVHLSPRAIRNPKTSVIAGRYCDTLVQETLSRKKETTYIDLTNALTITFQNSREVS